MTKAHLTLVTPSIVNRTVMPQRRPNADLRTREHLTEAQVQRLAPGYVAPGYVAPWPSALNSK